MFLSSHFSLCPDTGKGNAWVLEFSKRLLLHKQCSPQIDKWRERNQRAHSQGEKNLGLPVPAPSQGSPTRAVITNLANVSPGTSQANVTCISKNKSQICSGLYKDLSVLLPCLTAHLSASFHVKCHFCNDKTLLNWCCALFYASPDGPRPAMDLRCKCFNKKDCHGHQRLHRDTKFLD